MSFMNKKFSLLLAFGLGTLINTASAATLINPEQSPIDLSTFQKISGTQSLITQTNVLKQIQKNVDRNGMVHTRYQQYFRGIPVWGKQVITHEPLVRSLQSSPTLITGTVVQDIGADVKDLTPAKGFDSQAALDAMKQRYLQKVGSANAQNLVFSQTNSHLVYYIDTAHAAHLAYAVNFFVENTQTPQPASPYFLVDAKTKTVLHEWDNLAFDKVGTGPGGNQKTGYYTYGDIHNGANFDYLDVTCKFSMCMMDVKNVKTYNLKQGVISLVPFYYSGTQHEGTDQINGAISPLNDAQFFGGVIFNMYQDWYKTAPIDSQLSLRVHYMHNFENAFYTNRTMTFGDGADRFYPLVALDVVAHEVSHGFTEQHSQLAYEQQSGGMNEAFSDMAGKAAEFYMRGHNDWNIGADIIKEEGKALRYMDDPTKDGQSIGDARDYNDDLDVHHSSGVYNKAFYKLATSPGWDTHKAFDVMVAANANYWIATIDFAGGASGVVHAAKDLNYNVADVVAAFDSVGITCNDAGCQVKPR